MTSFQATVTTAQMQRLSGWPPQSAVRVAAKTPPSETTPWTVVTKILDTFGATARLAYTVPDTLLDVLPATANAARMSVLNTWALALSMFGFSFAWPWKDGKAELPNCETADGVDASVGVRGLLTDRDRTAAFTTTRSVSSDPVGSRATCQYPAPWPPRRVA